MINKLGVAVLSGFLLGGILGSGSKAWSIQTTEHIGINEATHAILGEARGEGYPGMYAHAWAIRNRGTLRGVYGARAKFRVSAETQMTAEKAYTNSGIAGSVDPTHGATHWLSDYDLNKTTSWKTWIHEYSETAYIGHTHFYKLGINRVPA